MVGRDAGVGETARAATRMASLLAGVEDPIVRDKIVRGVAGRLGVSDAALLEAAARSRAAESARAGAAGGGRRAGERSGPPPEPGRPAEGGASRRAPSPARGRQHFSAEAELIELILCNAAVAARVASEGVIAELHDPELRRLAELVLERRAGPSPFEASELLAELPRGMAERVSRRLATSGQAELARAGDEWFARRASRGARADRKVLIAQLRAAEHRRDEVQIAAALAALESLHRAQAPLDEEVGPSDGDPAADGPPELGPGDEAEPDTELEGDANEDF